MAVTHDLSVRAQTPRMLSDQLTIHEQALSARSGGQPDDGDFFLSQNCSRCCAREPCPQLVSVELLTEVGRAGDADQRTSASGPVSEYLSWGNNLLTGLLTGIEMNYH